ncbi:MAG TPA: hypothetical protein VIH42_10850 [Thermoguttaceae bacterium]
MSQIMESPVLSTGSTSFVERRRSDAPELAPACERRQFANSHEELSPEAAELAKAIDQYKLFHRRRFITYEEMLGVIKSLGYRR